MQIQETAFESIDLENESFRISEDLAPPLLEQSLRSVGQLNPVLLLERNSRKIIVCGFRRVRALKRIAKTGVLARIVGEEDLDPLKALRTALWDNLPHRQLNPLECARVLFKLKSDCGLPDSTLIQEYLPLLGLSPAEKVLRNHLLLYRIDPVLRLCFSDGRLTQGSIDALSGMPAPVQERIGALLGTIRLSASLQKKVLTLLDDLGDSALDRPEIVRIAHDPGLSPFQRGEKVYEVLYRLRNPRLSEAMDNFIASKTQLGIPGTIRIAAHPYFEEPGIRVEFEAADPEKFRKAVGELRNAAESPDLEKLFKR